MKSAIRVCFAFFLVIAIHLTCVPDTEALFGQSYLGDGATNNPVVPPGGWLTSGALDGACLTCHDQDQTFGAPDMRSYLMTGHKNMLRMVQTTPVPLTGPDGFAYTVDQSGNIFNWSGNTVNIIGFCTNAAFADETSCATSGGIWISGSKTLYYIFDGWMGEPAAPRALYDGSYIQVTQKTTVSYSCGRCHATGFTMDTTIKSVEFPPLRLHAPELVFPGITWTPGNPSGRINLDPDGDGPAIASSWVVAGATGQSLEGVQCERCHDATHHFDVGRPVTVPRGRDATALCTQCHRQEHTVSYTSGGLGANIKPTPFSDNSPALPASEPLYPFPAIEVGGHGGYAPEFYAYSTGMEFLNSVHAKFTGNFQQIADATKYDSAFSDGTCSVKGYLDQASCEIAGGAWTSFQGGCTTCHDVHQSTVPAVNATPIRRQCGIACHTFEAAHLDTDIKHPYGVETPLGDMTDVPGACAICHMPRPNNGEGLAAHLWRISTDPNYRTFPTEAQWTGGQKTAGTAPAGSYAQAVWIDLDLACGQCHGGSAGPSATKGQAVYFSKAALAVLAVGMHTGARASNDPPTASATITQNGLQVQLVDTSTDPASNLPYGFNPGAVAITWGDGTAVATGNAGATFTHTYAAAGAYNIQQTVTDAAGLSNSVMVKVTVTTPKYSLTVDITPDLASTTAAAYIYLKTMSGATVQYCTTRNGCTFSNVAAGTYKVQMYRSGMTFAILPYTTNAYTNPAVVTVNANISLTATHTP